MMYKKWFSLLMAGALIFSCAACGGNADDAPVSPTPSKMAPGTPSPAPGEVLITLSDAGVTFSSADGTAAGARTGDEIIYYKDGTDESYGEGEDHEKHSAEEAAAHTVVTITRPGTYRLTGKLSRGQIFVDLGEDAKRDPEAVVTLILDNVDITCTVAPAVLFYRVFECNTEWVAFDEGETDWDYQGSPVADTAAAGANVIIAAGSRNNINGSHVARIYKEGTTKKLHKYDGAFYSKMSMNIYGDNGDDSGVLNIIADNEGLNSEMHLTVHGGTVNIESQDDGINTNEDYVSVTTINGGSLSVTAGRGAEGDGIDSNGYLTINGGTVCTVSNPRTPDGGIDADSAITINGGTLYAFGTRNDAADSTGSAQPYMELSFASTLSANSVVEVKNERGTVLWTATTPQNCQAITLTAPELQLDTVYNVYVNGTLQCYSGNSFGMMGGFGGGMFPGSTFDPNQIPGVFDPSQMGQRPEGMSPPDGTDNTAPPEGMENMTQPEGFDPNQMPEGFDPNQMGQRPNGAGGDRGQSGDRGQMGQVGGNSNGETDFILTGSIRSFSGVCDSAQSGKTAVTFRIEGQPGTGELTSITCSDQALAADQIQITVTDDPSEDYAESCLLSEGLEEINDLLPDDTGNYVLTVAVVSGCDTHTGATQIRFTVTETEPNED